MGDHPSELFGKSATLISRIALKMFGRNADIGARTSVVNDVRGLQNLKVMECTRIEALEKERIVS